MRIAILGGTGSLGKGLAVRLAEVGYEVIVGSRDKEKAIRVAEEYSKKYDVRINGASNAEASTGCDMVIVTIPWRYAFDTVLSLKEELKGKIVVSPIVPMERTESGFVYVELPEGSAAEKLARILPESRVISAYHNIPARRFSDPDAEFEWDVAVCGDDEDAKRTVMNVTNEIKGLRALDAGGLRNSKTVESLTPLLINIAIRNGMKDLGVRFV